MQVRNGLRMFAVVKESRIPEDWNNKSWMVGACSTYRSITLLDHVMKLLERVIESRVRKIDCWLD